MFRKTTKFKRGNRLQKKVNARFEYFFHYWRIAKSENIDIFFDTVKMESHPYLIEKIHYQLYHNLEKSFDKFKYFFLSHPLFDTSNIIANQPAIQNLKDAIMLLCVQPLNGQLSKAQYIANEAQIKALFKQLTPLVTVDYNKKLNKALVKILLTNRAIDDKVKADIRFLVNAYFVQLYHKGYSIKYISELNDIIFFYNNIHAFPFEKKTFRL